MTRALLVAGGFLTMALLSGLSATYFGQREPVEYYIGHSHGDDGTTQGAPQHRGGLDRNGCHDAAVPYHCH